MTLPNGPLDNSVIFAEACGGRVDCAQWAPYGAVTAHGRRVAAPPWSRRCRPGRFELLKAAVVVAEIPRNPSGKLLKRVLREQFLDKVHAPE